MVSSSFSAKFHPAGNLSLPVAERSVGQSDDDTGIPNGVPPDTGRDVCKGMNCLRVVTCINPIRQGCEQRIDSEHQALLGPNHQSDKPRQQEPFYAKNANPGVSTYTYHDTYTVCTIGHTVVLELRIDFFEVIKDLVADGETHCNVGEGF